MAGVLKTLQGERLGAMSLVFVLRVLQTGGAERQTVALAKALHGRGHDVCLVTFYPEVDFGDELRRAGVPVECIGKKGRWDVAGFLWRLGRRLRGLAPDAVYGVLDGPNICLAVLKPFLGGARVVWGLRASVVDYSHYAWISGVANRVERLLARIPDLIVANSRAGADHAAARGFPSRRMTVVPNGFDTDYFRPDEEAGRRMREGWGVAEDDLLVGMVARLDPIKNHPLFLEAAARFTRREPRARFVCVGGGAADYRRRLHAQAERLGLTDRLIWEDGREDMPTVYAAMDICCLSSASEGFPNVIGEAMACGVPCVSTDVGDARWLLGDSGELAPPGDANGLADAMARMLRRIESGGASVGAHARRRIEGEFSVSALARRTEEALAAIVGRRVPNVG